MKRVLLLCLIASPLFAISVFRVDPSPVMTTAGTAPPGGYPALHAVAGATINICTDAACSIAATTYADSTGNTACPATAQVTLPGTALCTPYTGAQGQFGWWLQSGTYYYRVTFPSGQTYGPFPLTSNTTGVTSLVAGTGISVNNGGINTVTVTNTGVITFNGRAGAVVPTSGDYTYSLIGGPVQGNTTKPQMAGTNSGASGALLCNDANGNATTSACTALVTSFNSRTGAVAPTTGDYTYSQIGGATQGNTTKPQMAGTNSASVGATLCNDASGNATTSGCLASVLPSGSQLQKLRIKPNVGNSTTTEFAKAPNFYAPDYVFPSQTCDGSNVCIAGGSSGAAFGAGNNSVTMTPVPLGVNGSDTNHGLYVHGGTGTAEVCTINGGSGTSGSASGTIILNCANTHSGAFTIDSNGGIPEALQISSGTGGLIVTDSASPATVHGVITIPTGVRYGITGSGGAAFSIARGSDYLNGDLLYCNACAVNYFDLGINNSTGSQPASGSALHWKSSSAIMSNAIIFNGYQGLDLEATSTSRISGVLYASNDGFVPNAPVIMRKGAGSFVPQDTIFEGCNFNGAATSYAVYKIQGADSLRIIGGGIGFSQFGIAMVPDANVAIQSFIVNGVIFDTQSVGGIAMVLSNAGSSITNGIISNNTMNGESGASGDGIDLGVFSSITGITNVSVEGNTVVGYNAWGISVGPTGSQSDIRLVNNIAQNNNRANTGGVGAIRLIGVDGVAVIGNAGNGGNTKVGLLFQTSLNHAVITDNQFNGPATAINQNGIVPTNSIIRHNDGVDDVSGTVADAATVALPINPLFTLTGTGTTVTAFSNVFPAGYQQTMIPTNASPPPFTAGATIGNSCTPIQNNAYTLTSDGTKIWITGPGCVSTLYNAAGTVQALPHTVIWTCTLGTSCVITFTGAAAFTGTSTYYCSGTDQTAAAAVKIVNTAAGTITVTGTGTDVISGSCTGN